MQSKYIIVYKYSKKEQYTWEKFNYLDQIRTRMFYPIMHSYFFKLFVLKGNKYVTLCNKIRFKQMIKQKVVNNMVRSDYKSLLMKNMREFRSKMEKL